MCRPKTPGKELKGLLDPRTNFCFLTVPCKPCRMCNIPLSSRSQGRETMQTLRLCLQQVVRASGAKHASSPLWARNAIAYAGPTSHAAQGLFGWQRPPSCSSKTHLDFIKPTQSNTLLGGVATPHHTELLCLEQRWKKKKHATTIAASCKLSVQASIDASVLGMFASSTKKHTSQARPEILKLCCLAMVQLTRASS